MTRDTTQLAEVVVGGVAEPWEALGFAVHGSRIALANGSIRVIGGPAGVQLLVADGIDAPVEVDGVTVEPGAPTDPNEHPNGAFELDHVVITTDSLERTSAAVAAVLGLPQRRIREVGEGDARVRQAFHRFPRTPHGTAGCIVEIVESIRTRDSPPGLFGLVVTVTDLETLCDRLGPDMIGRPKSAVQPGRLIATVRSAVGIGFPLALMSPAPA